MDFKYIFFFPPDDLEWLVISEYYTKRINEETSERKRKVNKHGTIVDEVIGAELVSYMVL